MWQAAHPVARKLPRSDLAGVQRWQDVHSFRRRSRKTSPLSLKVGKGSSLATAPGGRGWPFGGCADGVTTAGVIANSTPSRVACNPFGKRVPLCVPDRCAMIDAFTARVIALWQVPHVRSTTRRSLGFAHIPAWALSMLVAA